MLNNSYTLATCIYIHKYNIIVIIIINLNFYSANTNKKLIYLWRFTISTVQCPEYLKASKICYEVLKVHIYIYLFICLFIHLFIHLYVERSCLHLIIMRTKWEHIEWLI